jgi:hypothetical protein
VGRVIPHRQIWTGSPYGSCYATAIASALDLDLAAVPNFVAFRSGRWWDAVLLWAQSNRLHVERLAVCETTQIPAGLAVVASGQGPRGHRHAVVWQDGRMVHDPHPSDAGLVGEPDSFTVLRPCPGGGCTRCDGGDARASA